MKQLIKKIPIVGTLAVTAYRLLQGKGASAKNFRDSGSYWEARYKTGGNSGSGSYGKLSLFKAEIINGFVKKNAIKTVMEFGCGDGNQLQLADYRSYQGFDVSETAIASCRRIFESDKTKSFSLMSGYQGERAELCMSLDVIYHLVEDSVFESYMKTLFDASERFVIIYSSNKEAHRSQWSPHVRHRKFTSWVETNVKNWSLIETIPNRYPDIGDVENGSFADFYVFKRDA